MRPKAEVDQAVRLARSGLSVAAIVRSTGVPRRTITHWLSGKVPNHGSDRGGYACPRCSPEPGEIAQQDYVYLLGLYLGDGCIYRMPKRVWRLGIFCSDDYPNLMRACQKAMGVVLPTKVGLVPKQGCVEVTSYSKHWPCLFPQHGPGPKHLRKIELADWQQTLVDADPRPLIKGLIHSDGTRVLNHVPGTYYGPYPRYHFTSASNDIRKIFTDACEAIGVKWRQNNSRKHLGSSPSKRRGT